MLDGAAAQHGDFSTPIEDGQVDRDFHGCERRLIQCIERLWVAQLDDGGLAGPAHMGGSQIDRSLPVQAREQFERLRPWQKHGVAQVAAELLVGQNVGQEDSMVNLDAILVLERQRTLRRHGLAARRQSRDERGGQWHQVLHAQELATTSGQPGVKAFDMEGQKSLAQVSLLAKYQPASGSMVRVPRRSPGELCPKLLAEIPEIRASPAVSAEIVVKLREGREPSGCVAGG